jgi:hypothetical protein
MQAADAQDPALDLRDGPLGRPQAGVQQGGEFAIPIGIGQYGGDAQCVLLVAGALTPGEAARPQCRIDFRDGGSAGRYGPPVERPEMHARLELLADEAQPRDAGMGGLCHRSLHIEVKNGFGAAGAFLSQPPPAGIAHPRRAIPGEPVPHEIDIGVVLVSWPVAVKVVEEVPSVGRQPVHLEVAQRE